MAHEKPRDTFQERIGEGLVRIGALSPDHCSEVIRLQKEGDVRLFGEIAIALGYIKFEQLLQYLSSVKGG